MVEKPKNHKGGKKNRKFGRKKRRPSQVRYTFERRWEKNKKRKAQKYANKTNRHIKIKISGEWVTIHPQIAGENSSPAGYALIA